MAMEYLQWANFNLISQNLSNSSTPDLELIFFHSIFLNKISS